MPEKIGGKIRGHSSTSIHTTCSMEYFYYGKQGVNIISIDDFWHPKLVDIFSISGGAGTDSIQEALED